MKKAVRIVTALCMLVSILMACYYISNYVTYIKTFNEQLNNGSITNEQFNGGLLVYSCGIGLFVLLIILCITIGVLIYVFLHKKKYPIAIGVLALFFVGLPIGILYLVGRQKMEDEDLSASSFSIEGF